MNLVTAFKERSGVSHMRWIRSVTGVAFTALIIGCSSDGPGGGGGGMPGTAGASGAGTAGNSTAGTAGSSSGTAGTSGSSGTAGTSGAAGSNGGASGSAGAGGNAGSTGAAGTAGTGGGDSGECTDTGAADNFSFFVTSYHHIKELSGSENGFGGDLRYNGAATGLEGADAICQEMARRVCFGHRTWRAYLSTSTVNAKDRVGTGPWYDYAGLLVASDLSGLLSGDRPAGGAIDNGTYDETGTFHDGMSDVNNDGIDDDDHDTMTATLEDGTYAGFSCEDWTSTTATNEDEGGGGGGPGGFPGLSGGIQLGHSWPAASGQHWVVAHAGHQCAAGTNFIQNGGGNSATVGGGGGYGGFYCFALPQ
jgi:hypothetical protein